MKVYFDLDGTLIDISKRHYSVYENAVLHFGGKPLNKKKYWQLKRNKTCWSKVLLHSNLEINIIEIFLEHFIKNIEKKCFLKKDTLFPYSVEILNQVSKFTDCYLVSLRRNKKNLLEQLDWLGIKDIFKDVRIGHSENQGDDIKTTLIKYDDPVKGIIIGDTEADIMTGKNLGLYSIGVLSGIRSEDFLKNLNPDLIIKSIKDFPLEYLMQNS